MKRAHLSRAKKLDEELSALETKLLHFEAVETINISSACCLELGNYDEPSIIGRGFRAVKAGICQMLKEQIDVLKTDLQKLGVNG